MANEFIARNGLISRNNSTITGSLTVTGGITGSLFGTASRAVTASYVSSIGSNILNNGENYLITTTGGDNLQGEGNLTFDSTTNTLNVLGIVTNGVAVTATGGYSHAQGVDTEALGTYSHTEGEASKSGTVNGFYTDSISAGVLSIPGYGDLTPSIGVGNLLLFDDVDFDNIYGRTSFIIASASFDGTKTYITLTDNTVSTSQAIFGDPAYYTSWSGYGGDRFLPGEISHAEGLSTVTLGYGAHAEGFQTIASGVASHTEGLQTIASADHSHAEGVDTLSTGYSSHAEGTNTKAKGEYSHTEGEGTNTGAFGYNSTSILSGVITIDAGYGDVKPYLDGAGFITLHDRHFDNAYDTQIFKISSIAGTVPTVVYLEDTSVSTSHAYIGSPGTFRPTGADGVIPAPSSHAEGRSTSTVGFASHAEGFNTQAAGPYSHAEGYGTVTIANYQHASGMWNTPIDGEGVFVIGNGTSENSRANLLVASGSQVNVVGSLEVSGVITGSLFGTASYTNISTLGGFVKNGNSFGTTAFLGTNDNQALAFETSGSERMRITSTGNVGIGTTTPQRNLDSYTIGGAFQGNNYVRLGVGANGAYGGNNHLEFSYNDYGNIAGGRTADNIVAKIQGNTDVVSATDVGGTLIFSTKDKGGTYLTAPVERMRITSTGNVGIGTTAPTAKLHIAAPGSGSTDIALKVRNSADTADLFGVLGDGNIVINGVTKIASSATILTINRPDAAGAAFQFSNGVNTAYGEFRWKDASGADLARMSSTGRLGIGTTAPNTALHVSGGCLTVNGGLTAYPTNGGIQLYYVGTTGFIATSQNAAGLNADLAFSVGNNAEKMRIASTGNVGIGITNPSTPLHVSGTIQVQTATGNTFYGQDSGGSYARTFGVELYEFRNIAGDTKVRINTSTGNVGIGTTAPSTPLHVNGSLIAGASTTSGLYFNTANDTLVISNQRAIERSGSGLYYGNSNTLLQLRTNSTARLHIDNTGNIGIGTTLPEQLIGINVSGVDSKANGLQFIVPESAAGSARIGIVSNTAGNNRQQAYIKFSKTNTSAGRQGSIGFFTAGLDSDTNTEQMRIDSLGNIGIGTTAPNAKLDVSGSAIITGSLTVTAGITGSLFGSSSYALTASYALNGGGGGGSSTIIDDSVPTVVDGGTWYQPASGSFSVGITGSWVTVGRDGANGAPGGATTGSVSYVTIASDLVSRIATSSGAWDFSQAGIIDATISTNTSASFSNLQLNKTLKVKIMVSGSAALSFPSYCKPTVGSVNPSGTNGTYYAYFDCWNATSGSEIVLQSIVQLA